MGKKQEMGVPISKPYLKFYLFTKSYLWECVAKFTALHTSENIDMCDS